jgi:hypothetical protein
MKLRTSLALGCLIACAFSASTSRADDRRFSSTLSVTESAQIGLPRLSSDQLAVLDALVRKDVVIAEADPSPTIPRAALFSQRLTAEERRLAGFTLLSETEIAQIDAGVERFEHPAPFSSALTDQSPRKSNLTSVMLRRAPEIHGSVTLMVAGGSGGYSAYGGAINLSYYDPVRRFAIDVGYSEIRSSGGYGYCNRLFPDRRLNDLNLLR